MNNILKKFVDLKVFALRTWDKFVFNCVFIMSISYISNVYLSRTLQILIKLFAEPSLDFYLKIEL